MQYLSKDATPTSAQGDFAINHDHRALAYLCRVAVGAVERDATDEQLLAAFLASRDGTAFEALVRRHGPMVLGVCRRVLGNTHDAEDAFQATFLVLVRRAASVVPRDQVGNFLYGVAHRTALQARAMRATRRGKERQAALNRSAENFDSGEGTNGVAVLDEAIKSLPERYRVAVVLCELEGRSRREVARTLGLPEGTLSSRLAKARKLLARRLRHRGVTLGVAAVLAAAAAAARASLAIPLPVALGSGSSATPSVLKLAASVEKAMILKRLQLFVVCLGVVLAVGLGLGAMAGRLATAGDDPKPVPNARPQKPGVAEDDLARLVGTWRLDYCLLVEKGLSREFTPAERRGYALVIDAEGTLTFTKGKVSGHSQFVIGLDGTKSPREMMLYPLGTDEDKSLLATYDIGRDGDLTVNCYHTLSRADHHNPVGPVMTGSWQCMILKRVNPPTGERTHPPEPDSSLTGSPKAVEFPSAPPPLFAVVTEANKDKGTITLKTAQVSMYHARAVGREIERDGKKVVWQRPVTDFGTSVQESKVEVEWLLATDAEGKKVEGDDLWKRLVPGTMVLHGARNELDPAFRKLLAKDILYLVPDGKFFPR